MGRTGSSRAPTPILIAMLALASWTAIARAEAWMARIPTGVSPSRSRILARPGDRALVFWRTLTTPAQTKVLELDRDGQPLRQVEIGSALDDTLFGVASLPGGGVAVLAELTQAASPRAAGVTLLRGDLSVRASVLIRDFTPRAVAALDDGSVLVGGARGAWNTGDAAVALLRGDGSVEWAMRLSARPGSIVRHLVPTSDGGCMAFLTMPQSAYDDGLIVKLARDGTPSWQRLLATVRNDTVVAAARAPDGVVDVAIYRNPYQDILGFSNDGSIARRRQVRTGDTSLEAMTHDEQGRLLLLSTWIPPGSVGILLAAIRADDSIAWATAHDFGASSIGVFGPPAVTGPGVAWIVADATEGGQAVVRLMRTVGEGHVGGGCPETTLTPILGTIRDATDGTEILEALVLASEPDPSVITTTSTSLVQLCRGGTQEPPSEVSPPNAPEPLRFVDRDTIVWEPGARSGSATFDVYRGLVRDLPVSVAATCLMSGVTAPTTSDPSTPGAGEAWFYLVSGRNAAGRGPLGADSYGVAQSPPTPCP